MKQRLMKYIGLYALLLFSLPSAGQQIKARIAGLESNSQYIELLAKEHALQIKEDSLTKVVEATRTKFREDPQNREKYRAEILALESNLFDVRNEVGIVAAQISAIEQEYIIRNLGKPSNPGSQEVADSIHSTGSLSDKANLVQNDYFATHLSSADLEALQQAQQREQSVLNFLKIYQTNYKAISELAKAYKLADDAHYADSLYNKYNDLTRLNQHIADSVSSLFGYIYDNKTYAYNYLLDKMNRTDLLSNFESKLNQARETKSKMDAGDMVDIISTYIVRKNILFDYEKQIAEMLGYDKALDSLTRSKAALDSMMTNIPVISIEERLFLDYADIDVFSPAKYNSKNPIPECVVYPKGIIYRILLGTYTKAQLPSIFRGVYPLGYLKGEDNKYRYYAGGYATKAEAGKAVEMLKKMGFRRPEIVVWDSGIYSNLDAEPDPSDISASDIPAVLYRIEIRGAGEDLDDTIKEVIRTTAQGKEISKLNDVFIVASFESAAAAETTAEAIRAIGKEIEVKIAKTAL